MTPTDVTTDTVTSRDGTTIGYRQIGQGPGLVVLHGTMESSQSHIELAEALANTFTVYVPDRRGRGMSGPFGDGYSVQKEIEDLDALMAKAGAHYLVGVSSGAIIGLLAALVLPAMLNGAAPRSSFLTRAYGAAILPGQPLLLSARHRKIDAP